MANVGEIPIALYPGMEIAQLQLVHTDGEARNDTGRFKGLRRPVLGSVELGHSGVASGINGHLRLYSYRHSAASYVSSAVSCAHVMGNSQRNLM